MHFLVVAILLSTIFVLPMKTMENPSSAVLEKEKYMKLPLQDAVKLFDDTTWDYFRIKSEDSKLQQYIQENNFKDLNSLGLAQFSPHSLLLVLLATVYQKNDACIFVKLTSWKLAGDAVKTTFFSHGCLKSSDQIIGFQIAQNNQSKKRLNVTLTSKVEERECVDLLSFDNAGVQPMEFLGSTPLKARYG